MNKVIMSKGLQDSYDLLETYNEDAIYITTDDGNIYLGDKRLACDVILEDLDDSESSDDVIDAFATKSYVDEKIGDLSTLPYTTYDGTIDMQSGVSYRYISGATEVVFSLASVADDRVGIYSLIIPVGDDVPTFSYPSDLTWINGELSLEANTAYELNILNGVVTYIYYSNE